MREQETGLSCLWQSRFGWIGAAASDHGLLAVTVPHPSHAAAYLDLKRRAPVPLFAGENRWLRATRVWLCRYLGGQFAAPPPALRLDTRASTDLQRRVWEELSRIPRGEVTTYSDLARRVRRPGAARAVGQCVARNRWAIVVPCHRVVGVNGGLTGYGGGIEMKRRLLELERLL